MVRTYLDMDGVLAQFEQVPHAVERFATEPGFFRMLKPTRFALELRERLDTLDTTNLYVLTATPHERADNDKRAWLEEHLPELASKVVFVRDGKDKAQLARGGHTLLDDYTENLKFWVESGGQAIKALNGYNGKTHRYKRYTEQTITVD